MPSRMQPAFFGGLFIGVLSALPFVSGLNLCCCLWVVTGGVLTSYLLQERSPLPITAGDGAVGGLGAGAIGAVLASVLGLAFAAMQGLSGAEFLDQLPQADLPPEGAEFIERMRSLPPSLFFFAPLVIFLLVFPIFGMLGGLLGVAIFKRNAPPPPPPGTIEVLPPE
jgi:hypothetical protein